MSEYGYCPRGGQEGVLVTQKELVEFAAKHKLKFIDQVIPLPGKKNQPDPKKCGSDHESTGNVVYWETEMGSHGWCCANCGEVIQWG